MLEKKPVQRYLSWDDFIHDAKKLLKAEKVPVYIDRYNENIGFVDIDAVLPEIRIHH